MCPHDADTRATHSSTPRDSEHLMTSRLTGKPPIPPPIQRRPSSARDDAIVRSVLDISSIANTSQSLASDVMRRHPAFFMSLRSDDVSGDSSCCFDDVSDASTLNEARFYSNSDDVTLQSGSAGSEVASPTESETSRNSSSTESVEAAANVAASSLLNNARFITQLDHSLSLNNLDPDLPCHIDDISFVTNDDALKPRENAGAMVKDALLKTSQVFTEILQSSQPLPAISPNTSQKSPKSPTTPQHSITDNCDGEATISNSQQPISEESQQNQEKDVDVYDQLIKIETIFSHCFEAGFKKFYTKLQGLLSEEDFESIFFKVNEVRSVLII